MENSKPFLISILIVAIGLAYGTAIRAQPASTSPTGGHNNSAPVTVTADTVTYSTDGSSGSFIGNVIVVQGEVKMRADQVRVTFVNGNADKIYATGSVVVDSPTSGTTTGDKGVYSVGPRTVLLTGNVVLKKGADVGRGSELTVDLNTGKATLSGGVHVPGQTNSRVQWVLTPSPPPK